MIIWMQQTLSETGQVENKEAKRKYEDMFGPVTSQSAWSKVSKRLRTQMKLGVSSEIVETNGKKEQRFWWHK